MEGLAQLQCRSLPVFNSLFCSAARNKLVRMPNIAKFQVNCQRRRSASYHPSVWEHDVIESLTTPYTYDIYGEKLDNLKQETRKLIKSSGEPSILIDSMQRLGVAYHFEEEIEELMNVFGSNVSNNLQTAALHFGLLREHGHNTNTDVFDEFKDRDGKWLESFGEDTSGLLGLYEASFSGNHGEEDLEEAGSFIVKQFKPFMEMKQADEFEKAHQLPLHWRMQRLEARNYIEHLDNHAGYGKTSTLLELAKLDYNLVQSQHQKEVKELTKWWVNLGFKEKLSFSRDRLVENYLWALGIIFEPQFSKCRIGLTKFVCILTAIDDMYDIYGSLDELERFTDAVKRWDISATNDLPEYMKICYLAMLNFGNEIVCDVLRDHGLNVTSNIKEAWGSLCSSYLVEARWFHSGYTPTLDDYLENAWISVGGPAAITHAFLLRGSPITNTDLESFKIFPDLVYWSSLITRLSDDLGTSKAEIMRGDVAKSIQCYMIKEGVSEEKARDHVKGLINISWRKLNDQVNNVNQSLVPKTIAKMSVNMARTAMCIFQHGDGIGSSNGVTREWLTSLIVEPVTM